MYYNFAGLISFLTLFVVFFRPSRPICPPVCLLHYWRKDKVGIRNLSIYFFVFSMLYLKHMHRHTWSRTGNFLVNMQDLIISCFFFNCHSGIPTFNCQFPIRPGNMRGDFTGCEVIKKCTDFCMHHPLSCRSRVESCKVWLADPYWIRALGLQDWRCRMELWNCMVIGLHDQKYMTMQAKSLLTFWIHDCTGVLYCNVRTSKFDAMKYRLKACPLYLIL